MPLPEVIKFDEVCIHLHTIPQRGGRTDRATDGQTELVKTISRAARDNNTETLLNICQEFCYALLTYFNSEFLVTLNKCLNIGYLVKIFILGAEVLHKR